VITAINLGIINTQDMLTARLLTLSSFFVCYESFNNGSFIEIKISIFERITVRDPLKRHLRQDDLSRRDPRMSIGYYSFIRQ